MILALYWPLFGHLNVLPIRIWDEARAAMNAYEMTKTGNLLVMTYDFEPEEYCVKPPMLIWLMAGSLKIFGLNEIGVRMPSAVAGLFTCLLLLVFSRKYLRKDLFGIMAVLVLISMNGYISRHVTRTGDYDALLVLFTTASCLSFFAFLETHRKKYIWMFWILLALGVLTKSVSALLFAPAFFIYLLYRRQLFYLLRQPSFYGGFVLFGLMVGSYYFLREQAQPGYLNLVWQYELGGRYNRTLGNHYGDFWYYFRNFYKYRMPIWLIVLPMGLPVGVFSGNRRFKQLSIFSGLCMFTYWLIVSGSNTKLEWYDAPMFPFAALICAVFIYWLYEKFTDSNFFQKVNKPLGLTLLFLLGIYLIPYQRVVVKNYQPDEFAWEEELYRLSYWLKEANEGKRDLNNHYLVYDIYNGHHEFYIHALQEKGVNISENTFLEPEPGDSIIVCEWPTIAKIDSMYTFEVLENEQNVFRMLITGEKSNIPSSNQGFQR